MNAKKTLVAASLTAALLAAGVAQAGTLTIKNAPGKSTNFATEIFGGPGLGPNANSANQEFYAPDLIYIANDVIPAGTEIRFNFLSGGLDGQAAVFNSTVQNKHVFALISDGAAACTAAADIEAGTVVAGGNAGQFFVTVTFGRDLQPGDAAVVRLSASDQGAFYGTCTKGDIDGIAGAVTPLTDQIKLRNGNILGTVTEDEKIEFSVSVEGGLDLTPRATLAVSQYGVKLTGAAAVIGAGTATDLTTINSGSGDLLFSTNVNVGTAVADERTFLTSRKLAQAGTIKWDVAAPYASHAVPQAPAFVDSATGYPILPTLAAGVSQISDPAGNLYAPDGADTVKVSIAATKAGDLAAFANGDIYLEPGTNCDITGPSGSAVTGTPTADGIANLAVTGYKGQNIAVCFVADGVKEIVPTTIKATMFYDNAEPSYQDPTGQATLGTFVRNGCNVDLPNIAYSTNGQEASFIRLINKSSTSGTVRASVWAEDGSLLANAVKIKDNLAAHATGVWSVKDFETATGITPKASGRMRIALKTGFPTCDAMGLQRTITSGELKNFSNAAKGNDNYNTMDHNGQ